jgi:TetR/AcrR family transcriptional repressor of nem operon
MRRSREDAARTRRRAVAAASRLFRERGIESVSLGDVMAKLKMTAGGFYRHFKSKEALAAEACAAAFTSSGLGRDAARSPEAMLWGYLSKAHRDEPSEGCPLPALASDMARQPAAVRRAYTEGVRDAVRRIREVAPAADPTAHLALLAGMVGALAISRAVNDEKLSEAVLRDTRNFWIPTIEKLR